MIRVLKIKNLMAVAMLCGSVSGCVWVEDTADLQQYIAQVQGRDSRPIKPLPEFAAYEAFVYEGATLRNPFLELVKYIPDDSSDDLPAQIDLGNVAAPGNERLKAYLESFAIKELTMVGTIAKSAGNIWALIVDSNGEIHRVAVGDYVGLDHGKVLKVDSQKLKLLEIISNGRGGWITRPRSIELVESKDP